MTKKKTVRLLFWIALAIYIGSLFLPFRMILVSNTFQIVRTVHVPLQNPEPQYGYEFVPVISLIPIALIALCIFLKHTNFGRWSALIIAILMVFPLLPFYFFSADFCLFCKSEPAIGVYVQIPVTMFFLIATIINFRIPTIKINPEKTNLLDNFDA